MPSLNVPQAEFLELPQRFRAFVSGFGGGKTWVGCSDLCRFAWEHPGVAQGYFAPTFPQIRDIFYPTIEEVAADWGLKVRIHASNKEVTLYAGGKARSVILCRSMEKANEIVGFKIGNALVDEIDILKVDKAQTAWRKIIARMRDNRQRVQNRIGVATTPEGFKFAYQQFVKAVREKPNLAKLYGMVQASTYDNEVNLPIGYIDGLRQSYPPQLIDAYLDGQFVNLAMGSVYPNFDRVKNHTDETIEPGEPLHIGVDFNVLNMTGIVSVIRGGLPRTLAEVTGVRDTPTLCRLLKERYKDHAMTVYPDASGQNTSSKNASESDLSILRQNGFTVKVNPTNPLVKDRVLSVHAMILNDVGERRWLINTDRCPKLTEALEQQAYDDNGEPDKDTGYDHPNDAVGYFLTHRYPVAKRSATASTLKV